MSLVWHALPAGLMAQSAPVTEPREILRPAFPDDTGEADPLLASALAKLGDGTGSYTAAMAALVRSRVLVPVVAVLGESDENGAEKTSDMATVLIRGADGRQALLAFSSTTTMQAWRPDARPVAVRSSDAAKAAVQEQADALLIDVAGPAKLVVEGDNLEALASDWQLAAIAQADGTTRAAWLKPAPGASARPALGEDSSRAE